MEMALVASSHSKMKVYIDGASRGNPGQAGVGVVVCDAGGRLACSFSHYLGRTTNNVAEYQALILALRRCLQLGYTEVEVLSDSELVVKQLLGAYKVRNRILKVFHSEAKRLMDQFEEVNCRHIPREANQHADRLANEAIDCAPKPTR